MSRDKNVSACDHDGLPVTDGDIAGQSARYFPSVARLTAHRPDATPVPDFEIIPSATAAFVSGAVPVRAPLKVVAEAPI